MEPAKLLKQLDKAIAKKGNCQLYVPGLCAAAGHEARASAEKRRFDMLADNAPG